jgi:hypothetical protein
LHGFQVPDVGDYTHDPEILHPSDKGALQWAAKVCQR